MSEYIENLKKHSPLKTQRVMYKDVFKDPHNRLKVCNFCMHDFEMQMYDDHFFSKEKAGKGQCNWCGKTSELIYFEKAKAPDDHQLLRQKNFISNNHEYRRSKE